MKKPSARGMWVIVIVAGLLSLPWAVEMARLVGLKRLVYSLTEEEVQRMKTDPKAAHCTEYGAVVSRPATCPQQYGIVKFKDGGHVRFAFRGHPAMAVFAGEGYHRTVTAEVGCCDF